MPTKVKGTTGVDKIESGAVITNPAFSGDATVSGSLTIAGETAATQNSLGVRNLIINGDMRIAQRGTSIAILSNTVTYSIDRFTSYVSSTALISVQQDTDVPNGTGFKYSHKTSVTTADATLDASDNYQPCYQSIEGYNIAHLNFGTSNAQTVTLSFWVKSNKTGTYPVSFRNGSLNLSYITNFTIDSANTWENKTVTFTGATSGTWASTNGTGLIVGIMSAAGTTKQAPSLNTWVSGNYTSHSSCTNWADSTSNYINITGVQLEVGDTATPFEHRPYDMELQRCQRYYWKSRTASPEGLGWCLGASSTTAYSRIQIHLPSTMRGVPDVGFSGSVGIYSPAGSAGDVNSITANHSTPNIISIDGAVTGTSVSGRTYLVYTNGGYITASSEL